MTNIAENPHIKRVQHWQAEYQRVFQAFHYHEGKTMLQVARELGIERANVCRHVGGMKKAGTIYVVRTGQCPITRMKAQILSTHPYNKPSHQAELFR